MNFLIFSKNHNFEFISFMCFFSFLYSSENSSFISIVGADRRPNIIIKNEIMSCGIFKNCYEKYLLRSYVNFQNISLFFMGGLLYRSNIFLEPKGDQDHVICYIRTYYMYHMIWSISIGAYDFS